MSSRLSAFSRVGGFNVHERLRSVGAIRQRVAEGALGHVLELGGDSGANLFLYPRTITSLTALVSRPGVSPAVIRQATRQLTFPVDRRVGTLESLPLKDHAYDTVVSTFALGTTPDPQRALAEIRRVLKPGGRLLFVECGLSRDGDVAQWQQRCAPLLRVLCGVRGPLRLPDDEMANAGFSLKHVECHYLARMPRALGCLYEGVAFTED
ncbi:MAG: class I SAM-dependent methyltransferase [Gammaproteobacteria bacterium]